MIKRPDEIKFYLLIEVRSIKSKVRSDISLSVFWLARLISTHCKLTIGYRPTGLR